jgi:hypothetical protein
VALLEKVVPIILAELARQRRFERRRASFTI